MTGRATSNRLFRAFPLTPDAPRIVAAPRARKWASAGANLNRCLPVSIANESGWWVLNQAPFMAVSNPLTGEVQVEYEEGWKVPLVPAKDHFGGGILNIDLPFIWETEPGWNLHLRGPANYPLAGAHCLEAILESDWAKLPVAISWQLEPGRPVTFPEGFPVCQVVPVERGALESFAPQREYSNEALEAAGSYFASRSEEYLDNRDEASIRLTGYFRGEDPDGRVFEDHVTRRILKEFETHATD